VFSIQSERVVSKDNTVAIRDQWWQIDKCRWRHSLAGQTVTVHQHLYGTVSIRYGPHVVGRYDSTGQTLKDKPKTGRGKDGPVEAVDNRAAVSPRSHRLLEIASGGSDDSHFPTATNLVQPPSPKPEVTRSRDSSSTCFHTSRGSVRLAEIALSVLRFLPSNRCGKVKK
jgi:hypothetical protein